MKQTPKRNVALLGGLGLICLFLVGISRMLHLSSSPLDHAEAITLTTTWYSDPQDILRAPAYYWSGMNDLVFARNSADGVQHLVRRHTTTGSPTTETEGPIVHANRGYWGPLSPDGKWFVEWNSNKLNQRVPTFVAMDGTQRQPGEATWGNDAIWTQSSDALVSAVWRKTAALDRYAPTTGKRQKIELPGLSKYYEAELIDAGGHMIGLEGGNSIQFFDKSSGLPSQNYPNINAARVDLNHPDSKPEQWSIPVPKEIDDGLCFVSPSGERILWVVNGDTTPPLLRLLHHYIPGIAAAPEPGYRWLISGIHGEDMHEIASYHYHPTLGDVGDPYSTPVWMPDSKHISFIYQNTLFTRPID